MTIMQLARNLRAAFIKDNDKPNNACTLAKHGGPLDERRWDGRSHEACQKQWLKIRRECTNYKGCLDRIKSMELTSNPDGSALERCAELVYSEGGSGTSHLYDVIRKLDYFIRKPFPFMQCFRYLDSKKTLLHAADVIKGMTGAEKKARPVGVKQLKENERRKNKANMVLPV